MKSNTTALKYNYLLVISIVYVLLFCTGATGADQPIQIEADKMTAVEDSQSVIFSGNVDARQGNVRIRSDEMTIFYYETEDATKKKNKNAQQVKKIVCKGNVEVTSEEWLGTSDSMHYISKKNLVQLVGNAKAYKGQNMVQGERIDYHLDTGESEVFGAKALSQGKKPSSKKSGRVNMTILEQ